MLRGEESEAVDNIPNFSLRSKNMQKATGTDKRSVSTYKPAYKNLQKMLTLIGSQCL